MDMRIANPRIGFLSAVSVLALAGTTQAQTGPDLLLGQFGEGNNVVGRGEAIFLNNGTSSHDDGTSEQAKLSIYNASARFKLDLDEVIPGFSRTQPRAGFQVAVLDFQTDDDTIPGTLADLSIGIGLGVAKSDKWVAGISFGVGVASNNIINDGNAIYGKADIAWAYTLNEREKLGVVLDYNGNRTFLPDVPLPGFIYTRKLSEDFTLEVGFPYSDIQYHPTENLTLLLKFVFPDGGEARLDYEVSQSFGVFAALTQQYEAFHWNELDNPDRRILFNQTRAEIGVRGTYMDNLNFTAAVGYAFNTELNIGWDTRDADELAEISDEPYVRVGVEVKF